MNTPNYNADRELRIKLDVYIPINHGDSTARLEQEFIDFIDRANIGYQIYETEVQKC